MKPPRRRRRAVVAGGLVAALLVVATVVWWPQDRPAPPPTSVSTPRPSRTPTDPDALQKQLDRVVEAGAPGVVGLVRTGQQTWQGASGLGDLGAKRSARAGDRFRVGSVTKSFIATLVLQLAGEGRLGLDDSLERWLPGLVPGGERISVRQLLNHTSGLYNYTDDLPRATTQRGLGGPHVRGYAPPDENWRVSDGPRGLVDVTEMDASWAWAAGGMVSTTTDLARFYQALLGGQLLTPELLAEMRTTVDASQLGHGTRYGLGLEELRPGCGVELWGHGGSLEGYGTTAFSTPDARRQLVMATNLQPEPEPGAARAAVENILRREVSC
jgi:D-alanyl-D-alanine carboxypeptidase